MITIEKPHDDITLNEYQKEAKKTAIYPEKFKIAYPVLGLTNEAGEAAGVVKKLFRDNDAILTLEERKKLIKEVGDSLWYIAAIASDLDITLSEIALKNMNKLKDRQERGVLGGSGDDR